MPTPFTHLLAAQRLLADPAVPAPHRAFLCDHPGAYLLGSIAVDAQALTGAPREATHFFYFDRPMDDFAWREMFAQHPSLHAARHDPARRAFLAGYITHLSMDEIWSQEMTAPYFVDPAWATRTQRFLMLHILLIILDERDHPLLDPALTAPLRAAEPRGWLPFLSDAVLRDWRDIIHRQIMPGGVSETLAIYGARVGLTPRQFRAILDSPARLQADLWNHVPPDAVARVEATMTAHARAQMVAYLAETTP